MLSSEPSQILTPKHIVIKTQTGTLYLQPVSFTGGLISYGDMGPGDCICIGCWPDCVGYMFCGLSLLVGLFYIFR